ncbi:MAG: flagellar brake protein [Pseudomonadales bacterium]|nr:flagellar brake protein [Pseudomonadales bacterium]
MSNKDTVMAGSDLQAPAIPKDQILVDATEIGKALATVADNRVQLVIKIVDRHTSYVSALVDVDAEQGVLYLDELLPENGNVALRNGETFSVRALSRGIPVFFSGNTILSAEDEDGLLTYKVAFPRKMIYQQRRQFFRIAVAMAQNCDAVLERFSQQDQEMEKTPLIRGRVVDLSQRGMGLQILGELSSELEVGEEITTCEISLPDFDYIRCQAEVRHCAYDEEHDITHCGVKFCGMDKVQQRKLDRFVLHLQREARKSPSG